MTKISLKEDRVRVKILNGSVSVVIRPPPERSGVLKRPGRTQSQPELTQITKISQTSDTYDTMRVLIDF
jgi:hypothetical protein